MTQLARFVLALLPALLLAQPDRFALPACSGPGLELADRTFYLLCYDARGKVPLWTAHELRPERHLPMMAARPRHFRPDLSLSSSPIASNADYRGSGYSRGHLVPAEDMAWSEEALRSTFLLSNAVPQYQPVNAGKWRKLEDAIRLVAAFSDAVYVFSGPIFDKAEAVRIGPGQVAVPTHTFKVALAVVAGEKRMYAAILPNGPTGGAPLADFLTTVEEVERRTGLDFFSGLEDQEERLLENTASALSSSPASSGARAFRSSRMAMTLLP